jgi:hypothetical protein
MGISDRHSIRIQHGEQAEKRASLFFFRGNERKELRDESGEKRRSGLRGEKRR